MLLAEVRAYFQERHTQLAAQKRELDAKSARVQEALQNGRRVVAATDRPPAEGN